MDFTTWAASQISRLLPLDKDSLKQIVAYSAGLPADEAAEHLKNLLGDGPQALEFIASFNSRRDISVSADTESSRVPPLSSRQTKRKTKTLNSLPPPRQPDDYGNTYGAYNKKSSADDTFMTGVDHRRNKSPGVSSGREQSSSSSLGPSMPNIRVRTASPSKPSRNGSPAPTAASSTSNTSKKSKISIAGGTPMQGASSVLSDLESALRSLEITTNPTIQPPSVESRRCYCMATIHPLLLAAPNCLSCGKIICAKEGLAPCTFCGAALLSPLQTQEMLRALREERGREKMAINNAGQKRADISSFSQPPQKPRTVDSPDQDEALAKAQAHRDRLLGFQANNAKRTTVVDEAAAFETPDMGVNQWGSALERALQLKKQQKVLREMEWNARPEWEKRRVVVSVDLVGGKAVKRMGDVERMPQGGDENLDLGELDRTGETAAVKGGTFARNPLLGTKLLRPVWGSPDQEDSGTQGRSLPSLEEAQSGENRGNDRERKSNLWRRVQSDSDDNEGLILDGGVYGVNTSGRLETIGDEPDCG